MNLRIDRKHGDRYIYQQTLISAVFGDLVKVLSPDVASKITWNSHDGYISADVTNERVGTRKEYRVYEYDTPFTAISPQDYRVAIDDSPVKATLSVPDDYTGYQLYQYTPSGSSPRRLRQECYYAISPAGEVTCILNNSASFPNPDRITGFIAIALAHAATHGGTWLNCWDTYGGNTSGRFPEYGKLPQLYQGAGWFCYDTIPYDVPTYGLPSVDLTAAWQEYGEWEPGDSLPVVRYFRPVV